MSMYIPRGALILSRSDKVLGKLIRWGSKTWREAPTRVNHSMLVTEDGIYPAQTLYQQPVVVESDKRVRVAPLGAYHAKDRLIIWEIEMTPAERDIVIADALSKEGRIYGATQLIPQLIDNKLLFGLNVFRRLWKASPLDVCSRLIGEAFARIGVRFGGPAYAQSPDDQDDVLRVAARSTGICGRTVTCLLDQVGDPPLKRR